jgi:YCII-related domain
MPDFIVAYHGGKKPETPEQGAEQMAKWKAWIGGLGDAMVNPGTPLGKSTFINTDGLSSEGGPSALTGYSVLRADSMEAALDMAKACPFLEMGTIEVAQIMEMK